ncbi:MAG: hypothetical protein ACLTDC_10665 [Lachnospiraceae bacterium]
MAYKKQLSAETTTANRASLLGAGFGDGASGSSRFERPASSPQQIAMLFLHLKSAKPSPATSSGKGTWPAKLSPVESRPDLMTKNPDGDYPDNPRTLL